MITCEHCREAISSRGEKFTMQDLNEFQLDAAHTDADGIAWLKCEWCKEENPVDEMMNIIFSEE